MEKASNGSPDVSVFDHLIEQLREWGQTDESVEAIILVGSHARGTHKSTSDIDLVILTTRKAHLVDTPTFFARFGEIERLQLEYYGPVTSVRVWHAKGLEVEYGITDPSWVAQPLDPGTRKVLSDGYQVIVDKGEFFLRISGHRGQG